MSGEREPFDFEPKRAAAVSVTYLAAGALLWVLMGRGAGASLLAIGAFLACVTLFFGARGKG